MKYLICIYSIFLFFVLRQSLYASSFEYNGRVIINIEEKLLKYANENTEEFIKKLHFITKGYNYQSIEKDKEAKKFLQLSEDALYTIKMNSQEDKESSMKYILTSLYLAQGDSYSYGWLKPYNFWLKMKKFNCWNTKDDVLVSIQEYLIQENKRKYDLSKKWVNFSYENEDYYYFNIYSLKYPNQSNTVKFSKCHMIEKIYNTELLEMREPHNYNIDSFDINEKLWKFQWKINNLELAKEKFDFILYDLWDSYRQGTFYQLENKIIENNLYYIYEWYYIDIYPSPDWWEEWTKYLYKIILKIEKDTWEIMIKNNLIYKMSTPAM